MMNVATPASAPLPSHFAPPARMPSTRRALYHHPTLHIRSGSSSNHPRFLSGDFVPPPNTAPDFFARSTQQTFQQSAYSATQGYIPPAQQQQSYSPQPQTLQPRASLQRQQTTGSGSSLIHYIQSGPLITTGHRRQTPSTSTSNSSINRMASAGHSQYLVSNPALQVHPTSASNPPPDSYVARLRRAKATVWSARGQREDLDRSNSKDDKYKKTAKARSASSKHKLTQGAYTYETGLHAHPRQLAPRLSANEFEDSDYADPFTSGPNAFDTTAVSTKGSSKTKTTTSSASPPASAKNVPSVLNTTGSETPETEVKSLLADTVEDGRGSPEPLQSYYTPPNRRESKRISRFGDDDDLGAKDGQAGGGRRLFVVNASPSESEDES